jgi:phosphotransacetylase
METRQSHEVPTASTDSLPQSAASIHYLKTDSQSPKAVAPMGDQTVDFKNLLSHHHSIAYPTVLVSPQQDSDEAEAKTKSPEPHTIITIPETTTDKDIKPEETMSHSAHHESTSLHQFKAMLCDIASMGTEMVESSSTEQLVCGSISPAPLRPGKRVEDVKTIKRQPKEGWI